MNALKLLSRCAAVASLAMLAASSDDYSLRRSRNF
jgi:hypothetical protein